MRASVRAASAGPRIDRRATVRATVLVAALVLIALAPPVHAGLADRPVEGHPLAASTAPGTVGPDGAAASVQDASDRPGDTGPPRPSLPDGPPGADRGIVGPPEGGPGGAVLPSLLDPSGTGLWRDLVLPDDGATDGPTHGRRPGPATTTTTTAGEGAAPTGGDPLLAAEDLPAVAAATAASATGLVLLTLLGRSRRPSDPLDHPLRRRLLRQVRSAPGVHLADLARALEVDPSTVRYHADRLEDGGLVRSVARGRLRLLYPAPAGADGAGSAPGLGPGPRPAVAAVAKDPVRRRILRILTVERRIAQARLRRELGLAPSTVSHHARALREAGLVEARRRARGVELSLADGARDAVRRGLAARAEGPDAPPDA